MSVECDICVIGSGAGGGPVALTLAEAGHTVIMLEKGPWFTEKDFFKDEIACCRRSAYSPNLRDEFHVIEEKNRAGKWVGESTFESRWDFWNGNCVGGSSNFMSGFFHRLKPEDFRLLSEFGPIEGANVVDWPISYDDLEPYYTKVESVVGVSGRVVDHPNQEPRSTPDFPFPPTAEHPIAKWFDKTCTENNLHSIPVPRAILPHTVQGRRGCEYSGYCGSYGCSSGAKGSARAALLNRAVRTGHCDIRPHAKVYRLESDQRGQVVAAHYYDKSGAPQSVRASIFVIACQAIETSRLLLSSPGSKHPMGLANNTGQVGKNLLFSAGGAGTGVLPYSKFDAEKAAELRVRGPFVNRALKDWYFIDNGENGRLKGGVIEFLFRHPNPISRANSQKRGPNGLEWGKPLKNKLKSHFADARYLRFETFCDWLPTDNCFVALDTMKKDQWGSSVARVRVGHHEHDLNIGRFLTEKGRDMLRAMGAEDISWGVSGSPPVNLQAGGCRFGNDSKISVLNADCRAHDSDNLYVTDGSFMPTGGSVPYTWTIYANAFRVADKILAELS